VSGFWHLDVDINTQTIGVELERTIGARRHADAVLLAVDGNEFAMRRIAGNCSVTVLVERRRVGQNLPQAAVRSRLPSAMVKALNATISSLISWTKRINSCNVATPKLS
jgi:hypothetical protein